MLAQMALWKERELVLCWWRRRASLGVSGRVMNSFRPARVPA